MRKFVCDTCGEIPHVVFDGYPFGDRVLEGVKFYAFVNALSEDETDRLFVRSAEVWETDRYLRKLNKEHWMPLALAYAMRNDIAECPRCHDEVSAQPVEEDNA